MVNREVPKKWTFWVPALVVLGWVIYGDEGSALRGSCKRPRPMINLGGTQKVDFLGICFGGEGLGLNSWAMISFMGRRAPQHGVHARDDVRWSIWDKKPAVHPRTVFFLAGVVFGDCVARDDVVRGASRSSYARMAYVGQCGSVAASAAADIFSGRGFKESQRKISSPTII